MADLVSEEQWLENLCYKCNLSFENGCADRCKGHCENYKKLKRDLDVLEILKKYIRAGQWSNEYTLLSWEMKSKELKKIKEWLKGE